MIPLGKRAHRPDISKRHSNVRHRKHRVPDGSRGFLQVLSRNIQLYNSLPSPAIGRYEGKINMFLDTQCLQTLTLKLTFIGSFFPAKRE